MNIDDRKKAWDEMPREMMKSEKHFSKYGLTSSLYSHNTKFTFYQIINEFPKIKTTRKEFIISKFTAYLKLIDIEIKNGLYDKKITLFRFKVFLDVYCYVLQKDMLQKYIDLVKSGKTNDEQIITDFIEEYLKFILNALLELQEDRKQVIEIIKSVANIDKPLEKLNEIKLLISKSLLGHPHTLDSIQIQKLFQDTIQAKKDFLLEELKNETLSESSNQPKAEKKLKPTKTFPDYLLHDKREILGEKLKTEFNTETGIGIRLMIEALQANEPKLLTIENRQRKAIYLALKDFFNRDIKSYQAVFDPKFEITIENKDFNAIKIKLDFILESINKTE